MPPPSPVPQPPLSLANRVCSLEGRGDAHAAYERLGGEAKEALLELLPDGWSFEGKRVLDFGCGAGRTLRQFLREAETCELWGADIDAPSIRWLQETLCPPLHVVEGPVAPPLAFESGSFDLVWALSVFTHLTDTSLPWLRELHRLLKPGGLLVATYMGRWNSGAFLDEPWDEDAIGMNVLRADQDWAVGGPVVLMSDWWVREHWGRAFEVVATAPQVHGQTWLLLERRDVIVDVDELARPADDPRELRALQHNVAQLLGDERGRLVAVRREYEESLSWRLTGPLRRLAAGLRDRRARARPRV